MELFNELKDELLNNKLIKKFSGLTRQISLEVFPRIPNTFTNYEEYKRIFCLLFQYEVYCKLLSRDNQTYAHMCKNEQNDDSQRLGKKIRPPQYWIGYTVLRKIYDKSKQEKIYKINLFSKRPAANFDKFEYLREEDRLVNLELDLEKVRNQDLLLLSHKKLVLQNNKTQLNKLIEMRDLELRLRTPGTHLALVRRTATSMKRDEDEECIGIDYHVNGDAEDSDDDSQDGKLNINTNTPYFFNSLFFKNIAISRHLTFIQGVTQE